MKCVFLFLMICCYVSSVSAQDWPNLHRYADSNTKLMSEPVPKDRVVFIGNSITDSWIKFSPEFFAEHHYVDRGISGQTSPQMLLRFRADVINLRPRAVVIECGTNDIAGNTGPSTLEMVEDNIMSMVELAKANKIRVIIGSVPPSTQFGWAKDVEPADKIVALNDWLKAYAKRKHIRYVDYYSSLVNDQKDMKPEYSRDHVHPNKAGYTIMEQLVQEAIRK
jgi:lysophospholipase L1-like esterase